MNKKILILDDDADILEILEMLLSEHGYNIKTANSGEKVFEEIKDFEPDLLLMDVQIAGLNGLEICRDIKGNPITATLRIIIISGTPEINAFLGLPGAPDAFIAKPFDMDHLITSIAQQLAA